MSLKILYIFFFSDISGTIVLGIIISNPDTGVKDCLKYAK